MAQGKLILTRDQIAKFVGDDPRAIRQIELLIDSVQEASTSDSNVAVIDAGAALAGVNKLAGVVAQLAQDGAIEASNALAIAQAAERALNAVSDLAMVGATLPPLVPKRRNVGAWHGMKRQVVPAAGVAVRTEAEVTDIENGVWRDGANLFCVADAGVYNIEFSLQLDRNKGTDSEFWVWLAIDGVDVPESASVIRIKGNDAETVAAWNFLVELKANSCVSIIWTTDDVDTYLETFAAAGAVPAIPSAIVTITQEA